MKALVLEANLREGKKPKYLRAEGRIPATIYAKGFKSLSVSVSEEGFEKIYRDAGRTGVIDLKVDGKSIPTLIQEMQQNVISGKVLNIEFHKVDLKQKVTANIPLRFTGEAPGVKMGGYVMTLLHEVEIEGLPNDLPHEIEVDISVLEDVGHQIHVSNLPIAKGLDFITPVDDVVVKIDALRMAEEEEETTEDDSPDMSAEPEVIKKGKAEEEEEA